MLLNLVWMLQRFWNFLFQNTDLQAINCSNMAREVVDKYNQVKDIAVLNTLPNLGKNANFQLGLVNLIDSC